MLYSIEIMNMPVYVSIYNEGRTKVHNKNQKNYKTLTGQKLSDVTDRGTGSCTIIQKNGEVIQGSVYLFGYYVWSTVHFTESVSEFIMCLPHFPCSLQSSFPPVQTETRCHILLRREIQEVPRIFWGQVMQISHGHVHSGSRDEHLCKVSYLYHNLSNFCTSRLY